jgi:uncharacterized protein YutE (UPF0331/DUF86 family)
MSAAALDAAFVRRHLAALDHALGNLRHFVGRSQAELRRDLDARWAVERGLQICTQSSLDVAKHLAPAPGAEALDDAIAILRLGELHVLPADFALRFRGVADLHDVLVHAYLEYDLKFLYAMLNERLEDFAQFAQHVEAWLGSARDA